MTTPCKITVLVGSLRQASWSRRVAHAIAALAPPSLQFDELDIGQLAFYNEDSEAKPPPEWVRFREQVRASQAVLFVTPEYNRSVPAVLKNALDVGSRPYGHSVWAHRPAAVISASPGAVGGFGAHHHLRQVLTALDMPTLAHPELYIGGVHRLFDEAGALNNDDTRTLLQRFLDRFEAWIDANAPRHNAKPHA